MKICRRLLLPCPVSVLLLTGCSGVPSWLQGDWMFDAERSQQEAAKSNPTKPGDMLGGLSSMLQNMITPQLQGMEVMFTGTDEILTIRGQGKDSKYQVVKKTSTECAFKLPDGTVETYYRDGDEIYCFGTGGLSSFKVYFRRKS